MSDDDSAWTAGLAGFLWPIGVWVLVAMMLIESGKRREERKHLAALRRGREEQERASLVAMGKRELWELERQRGEP